jgi:hypothetical protein
MTRAILIDPEKRTLKYIYLTGDERATATEFQKYLRVKTVRVDHFNMLGISAPAKLISIAPLSEYRQQFMVGSFVLNSSHFNGRAIVAGEDPRTGKMMVDCPFTLEQLRRFIRSELPAHPAP